MSDLPGFIGSTISLAKAADTTPWWSHGYLAMGLLTAVVVLAGIYDFRTKIIPNWLVLGGFLLGLGLAAVTGYMGAGWEKSGWAGFGEGLQSSFNAFCIAFVPFFIIWRLGALGGGDVKLIGAVGAIAARWEMVIGAAFYGFALAMLIAIVIMAKHRIFKRTFQRITNAAMMRASKVNADLNQDTIRIPFGVPFGVGAILAGLEVLLDLDVPWSLM